MKSDDKAEAWVVEEAKRPRPRRRRRRHRHRRYLPISNVSRIYGQLVNLNADVVRCQFADTQTGCRAAFRMGREMCVNLRCYAVGSSHQVDQLWDQEFPLSQYLSIYISVSIYIWINIPRGDNTWTNVDYVQWPSKATSHFTYPFPTRSLIHSLGNECVRVSVRAYAHQCLLSCRKITSVRVAKLAWERK